MKDEKSLEKGIIETDSELVCLFCGKTFNKEEIFSFGDKLVTANYAVNQHIEKQHSGPLKALLNLPAETTGISSTQKRLITLLGLDLSDQEIAEQLDISTSTIRNHRFKLKEKKKQALYFIAVMNQLERRNKKMQTDELNIHNYDERFDIQDKEKQKVLKTFLNEDGKIESIPRKAKSKIILLGYIAEFFNNEKTYTEKEVNAVIQKVHEDFVAVRRYLIEYGFLARTNDGGKYWKI